MNYKRSKIQRDIEYFRDLWTKVPRWTPVLDAYSLKETSIKEVKKSIWQSLQRYWAQNTIQAIQNRLRSAFSLTIFELGNVVPKRGPSWAQERTKAGILHAHDISNGQSASSFGRLENYVNNGVLTSQQLQNISGRSVAASDRSWADITSTKATNQVNSCELCLDKARHTSKNTNISKS